MSEAIFLLLPHAFMLWTGTNLPFLIYTQGFSRICFISLSPLRSTQTHTQNTQTSSLFLRKVDKKKFGEKQSLPRVKTKRGIVNIQVFWEFSRNTGSSFKLSLSRTRYGYQSLYDEHSPDIRTFCATHTVNHLTPNVHYMGRTSQLTSRCCILYIYSTNIRIEYFKHAA